jgi:outer membrane protein W
VSVCASAAEAVERPLELSLRSGYSVTTFESLWAIPVGVDVGYRLSPRWSVGAYGDLGFIHTNRDAEDSEDAIVGHHYRVGVEAIYHASRNQGSAPWIGLGLGYDAVRTEFRSSSTFFDSTTFSTPLRASGFELANLQLGFDFRVGRAFRIGPFASGSLVAYTSHLRTENDDTLHVWANLGVKVTLGL